MTIENNVPTKDPVDGDDYTRAVSAEGDSVQVKNSVLKTFFDEGTATPYIDVVNVGDDKGLICTEQWSVGSPGSPKESVFGEGDSYGVGLENTTPDGTPVAGSAWHCDTANTTGLVITSATDVTTELSSDTGSTTGLFGGTTAGKYLLVGSDYRFHGIKAKIDTLGVVEPANVQGQYLNPSEAWVNVPVMVTDANFPYTQKANKIATCSSCSEQWRFGFNPLTFPASWEQETLTINGVEYTKYWSRYLIETAITTDPTMEQIKLHTNRFEINADGATEYFGRSRYAKTILIEKHTNALKNPSNDNLQVGVGITEIRTDNEFVNGASDGFILSGIVPEGLDSSIPLQVIIDWFPLTDNAGDVELEFETVAATDGFVYDGTTVPNAATPVITSVSGQDNELQRSTFLVDGSGALPGDKIYGSLFRDASSGNTDDTLVGNIAITGYQVIGYFWRP